MDRWVISLSGVLGKGPWDTFASRPSCVVPTTHQTEAYRWWIRATARDEARDYRANGYPNARVFRLVPRGAARKSLRALERAVVDAACAWVATRRPIANMPRHERMLREEGERGARFALETATRALLAARAERGL